MDFVVCFSSSLRRHQMQQDDGIHPPVLVQMKVRELAKSAMAPVTKDGVNLAKNPISRGPYWTDLVGLAKSVISAIGMNRHWPLHMAIGNFWKGFCITKCQNCCC